MDGSLSDGYYRLPMQGYCVAFIVFYELLRWPSDPGEPYRQGDGRTTRYAPSGYIQYRAVLVSIVVSDNGVLVSYASRKLFF